MSSKSFDFTVTQAQLEKIVLQQELEATQTWTYDGDRAALVHHGDTRPDVLTSALAGTIYEIENGLSDRRRSGDVVADLNTIITDLEPVTTTNSDGSSVTYWNNVNVVG